jgi:hypothetical protein
VFGEVASDDDHPCLWTCVNEPNHSYDITARRIGGFPKKKTPAGCRRLSDALQLASRYRPDTELMSHYAEARCGNNSRFHTGILEGAVSNSVLPFQR